MFCETRCAGCKRHRQCSQAWKTARARCGQLQTPPSSGRCATGSSSIASYYPASQMPPSLLQSTSKADSLFSTAILLCVHGLTLEESDASESCHAQFSNSKVMGLRLGVGGAGGEHRGGQEGDQGGQRERKRASGRHGDARNDGHGRPLRQCPAARPVQAAALTHLDSSFDQKQPAHNVTCVIHVCMTNSLPSCCIL